MNENDFPILESSNLELRKLEYKDLDEQILNISNKNISDQIFNIPFPFTKEDALKRLEFINIGFEQGERFMFAIFRKEDGQLLGEMGLHITKAHNHAQLGYYIGEKYWGKGYASEALNKVISFGFEILKLNKIFATHYENNLASGRVMQKNKMTKEGFLLEHYRVGNEYRSVFQYQITLKEYLKNKN